MGRRTSSKTKRFRATSRFSAFTDPFFSGDGVAERHLFEDADQHLDRGCWNPQSLLFGSAKNSEAQWREGTNARGKQTAGLLGERCVRFGRQSRSRKSLRHGSPLLHDLMQSKRAQSIEAIENQVARSKLHAPVLIRHCYSSFVELARYRLNVTLFISSQCAVSLLELRFRLLREGLASGK
jgi:hypothetical protein